MTDQSHSLQLDGDSGARPFDRLHDLLLSVEDVEDFLQQLVEIAVDVMDADVSAGVTLIRDGHATTAASSDAASARWDEIQYRYENGPCLTTTRTGEPILIEDLSLEDRFGEYRSHAMASGLRSALSLPLDGGHHAVGALNLYSDRPRTFGRAEQEVARRFAGEASRALKLALRLTQHAEVNAQLEKALESRTIIDQAMGIIMGQNRCSADEAFAILRNASQHRNIKLRAVATEIVDAVSRKGRL